MNLESRNLSGLPQDTFCFGLLSIIHFLAMFKQPPPVFGKFKQVCEEHYRPLEEQLLCLLPRSRPILQTLQLTMKGQTTSAFFYIPAEEEPTTPSGIIVTLFGEYPEPTAALTYVSEKEDVAKVNNF